MINGNALYALSPSRLRIAVCPQPRSEWSARSEARTNDLDGGQNVGGQLGLPAGAREEGAAITEGDRTPLGRCAVVPRRSPITSGNRTRSAVAVERADHPIRGIFPGCGRAHGTARGARCSFALEPAIYYFGNAVPMKAVNRGANMMTPS